MKVPFLSDVLEGFRTSWLVAALAGVFLLDLAVPDLLPLVDEAVLAISTLLMARWTGRRSRQAVGEKPPTKNVTPPGPSR